LVFAEKRIVMSDVRLGIIGIGAMGTHHAESVIRGDIKGMRLCAVADASADRQKWAKENLSGVGIYTSAEELMKSGTVDAVVLAGPHGLHASQAKTAIELGLNVLTEKPAGIRASEIEPAAQMAREKGLVYCVMFNQRTSPINQCIYDMIHSGKLGRVRRMTMIMTDCYRSQSYYDSGAWRGTWAMEGGGMIVNHCSHRMDLLQWWMGMPTSLRAHLGFGKWHDIEVDDDINAYFEFPGGATGSLIASTGDCPGTSILEFQGDNGKLALQNDRLLFYELEVPEPEFSRTFAGGFGSPSFTVRDITPSAPDPMHRGILQNFAGAVKGKAAPLVPIEEGLKSLRMTHAMYLSSWQNQNVALPADDRLYDRLLNERIAKSKPRTCKSVALDVGKLWK
jgi:predicted dehydrogenase